MLTPQDQVEVLLAEYHALYSLVVFRMTSLERRVPLAGATLAGFLGAIGVMPPETRLVFLLGLPVALIWFLRTTTNHARSFEDVLRRIEEIERRLAALAGRTLISFQSQHPSRGRAVGGRTGTETVQSVLTSSLLMLAACGYLFWAARPVALRWNDAYFAYLMVTAGYLLVHCLRFRRYRYEHRLLTGL